MIALRLAPPAPPVPTVAGRSRFPRELELEPELGLEAHRSPPLGVPATHHASQSHPCDCCVCRARASCFFALSASRAAARSLVASRLSAACLFACASDLLAAAHSFSAFFAHVRASREPHVISPLT